MSTDQAGVNDPTQNGAAEGSPGRAPRSSRRAIRQAERAAEREAILTGQQPLLTRREMRRLREEAAALKAAVEAGEITPEQARALQDPTAHQPLGAAGAGALGTAAAAAGAAPEVSAEAAAVDDLQVTPGDTAFATSAQVVAGPLDDDDTVQAPALVDSADEVAQMPAAAQAAEPVEFAELAEMAEPAELAEAAEAAEVAVTAETSPEAAEPEAAQDAIPSWRTLTADEAVALSELPTGLMDAVDVPISTGEADPAAAVQGSEVPAPVPTRASLRERLGTGQVPSLAGQGVPTDGGHAVTGQSPANPWGQPPVQAVPPAPAAPAQGEPGSQAPVPAADEASDPQDAGQAVSQGQRAAAPEAAAASTVRRPIVKIPAAAQGVRTVNASTGELSAVQPVSPEEAAGAEHFGPAVAQGDAAVDWAGEISQDAQETTVQEVVAVDEVMPGSIAAGVDTDADFDASSAPQWKALHDRITPDRSGFGGQQPVSPYSNATAGLEAANSLNSTSLEEGGIPGAGEKGGAPGATGSSWGQLPTAVPGVADLDSSSDEPQGSGRGLKLGLILLVVLVVALLVFALAWYFVSGATSTSAAQFRSQVEPWIQQII